MAQKLNKNRVQDTTFIVFASLILVLFTKQVLAGGTELHEIFDLVGYFLVAMCVVGRVYCTAFLGGHKNQNLIAWGPFSTCRNPLYFCSFIGACGIALMSNHIVLIIALPIAFCLIFFAVIRREETYLLSHFGEPYQAYCQNTPRFFPNFKKYHAPESITVHPRYLWNSVKDGMVWFVSLPAFELIEYLQDAGYIKPLFTLF